MEETTEKKKTEVLTEVTSVAKEEARTGQKINVGTPEEIRQKAMASFLRNKQILPNLFAKLSSKQKNRVLAAIIDLPVDGVPVFLKAEEEKLAFALGQRMISDRFILTYYHIVDEQQKAKTETQTVKETENVTE